MLNHAWIYIFTKFLILPEFLNLASMVRVLDIRCRQLACARVRFGSALSQCAGQVRIRADSQCGIYFTVKSKRGTFFKVVLILCIKFVHDLISEAPSFKSSNALFTSD